MRGLQPLKLEDLFDAGQVALLIGHNGIATGFHRQFEHHIVLGVPQERTPQEENLMPVRYSTVKVDHVLDDGAGDSKIREFSPQHALVFDDERHGQIDLAPTSPDELEQAEGLATAGAQSGKEDTGVSDDLRRLHGGLGCNTSIASN